MVKEVIKAIRLKNLILLSLIFFTVELFFYLKVPFCSFNLHSFLLYTSALLCAASGYIINDYFDKQSDTINNKLNKSSLSRKSLLVIYLTLILASLSAAILFNNNSYLYINIFCSLSLFLYSWKLQHLPIIGNLVIALLAGICPLLVFFSHLEIAPHLPILTDSQLLTLAIPFYYACTACTTTFSREIAKDLEDIKGDQAQHAQTLPIAFGAKTAKFTIIFLLGTTATLTLFALINYQLIGISLTTAISVLILLLIPILFLILKTYTANSKEDFNHLSNGHKVLFLMANVVLLIHTIF